MKKGKVEERDCCPDRFSASIDIGLGELTSYGHGGWEEGGYGENWWIGWMLDGWWMGEIWGELEGKEKHSSLDLISSSSLCKHPVEDGLQEIIIIVLSLSNTVIIWPGQFKYYPNIMAYPILWPIQIL